MRGHRLPDSTDRSCPDMQPGDYVKIHGIGWYCMTPNGHAGNLSNHLIKEHDDGSITVSPSIKLSIQRNDGRGEVELWHGYLELGLWRSC